MKVKGKRGWQIVQTFAGFHVRFVAGNSECIASTEVYPEERAALRAFRLLAPLAALNNRWARVDERQGIVSPRPPLPSPGSLS